MSDLREIIDAFGLPERPATGAVAKARVLAWARSEDLNALGALFSFLMNPQQASRVSPEMTLGDYLEFVPRYLERCFREDSETDWADGRYSAGWSLAAWMVRLAARGAEGESAVTTLSAWLASIYKSGSGAIRRAVVDATLEHAFESPLVRKCFANWSADPELSLAYREAMDWVSGGGQSPIGSARE